MYTDVCDVMYYMLCNVWFQLHTHIDETIGCRVPYTPHGQFLHVPPICTQTDWANNFGRPWWKDDKYCIGGLSEKTRKLRIVNLLTLQENTIDVWNMPSYSRHTHAHKHTCTHKHTYSTAQHSTDRQTDRQLIYSSLLQGRICGPCHYST